MRRWLPSLAVVVLLGGAAVLAVLAASGIALERGQARARERRAYEAQFQRALAGLEARLGEVAAGSLHRYRLLPPPRVLQPGVPPSRDWVRFLTATEGDREAVDPAAVLADLVPLASSADDAGLRALAALRAGILSRRVAGEGGDLAEARRLLEQAYEAPLELADPAGVRLAVAAAWHMTPLEGEQGGAPLLPRLEQGYLLLSEREMQASVLFAALGERTSGWAGASMRQAAQRARAGEAARDHAVPLTPGSQAFVIEQPPRVGLRIVDETGRDTEIVLHPIGPLLEEAISLPVRDVRWRHVGVDESTDFAEGSYKASRRLTDGSALVLAGWPPPTPAGTTASEVALYTGFGVLLLGTLLLWSSLRRIQRSAKMQAEFVAGVSHELKTPIASVRAMAELLAQDPGRDPARAGRYAKRIAIEMARLGSSVRGVLDAAQIERTGRLTPRTSPQDPAELLEDFAAQARPVIEGRGLTFETRIRPASTPVAFDAEMIRAALWNLIENACKFGAEGAWVELAGVPREGGYEIRVADHGPGVPADDARRIFERFGRGHLATQQALPGLGLGLHVVAEVARAHGGRIAVEATRTGGAEPPGATFVLTLPGAS